MRKCKSVRAVSEMFVSVVGVMLALSLTQKFCNIEQESVAMNES